MVDYQPINLREWAIFKYLDERLLKDVQLAHVFGYYGESAYFVTSSDDVYAIGNNVFGRLGIGDLQATDVPLRLDILCGKLVICFTTGTIHTLALTKNGDVYSWGSNTYGQIGNEEEDCQSVPCKVSFPPSIKILQISCGDRYCLALADNNKLYHWGNITWDASGGLTEPSPIKMLHDFTIVSICCGAFHAAAVTDNGKLLTWGVNEVGQLGIGKITIQTEPTVVGGQISDQFITKVACSSIATLALTSEKNLYAWGSNKSSALSVGNPNNIVSFPERVIFRKNIIDIACNNLDSKLCAEAEDPPEIYIWATDKNDATRTVLNDCNILGAFSNSAMPFSVRNSFGHPNKSIIEPIQGPVRDIGEALFNIKENSDLTVKLADGEVYVHSLILKTFSEHFKTLLGKNWSSGNNEIDMSQYDPKVYRTFLKYVYTGVLEPLEGMEIIALCDIAVSYFETELKKLCLKMFERCVTSSNVIQLYATAVGNHSELVDYCVQYTGKNLEDVVLSESFQTLEPALSKSLVLSAVKCRSANGFGRLCPVPPKRAF